MGKIDVVHKCLDFMLKCLKNSNARIDIYGDGENLEFLRSNLNHFNYKGISTDVAQDLKSYDIYISTSDLEGVCTTTIEGLLMHKKVLIRNCPCNEIFSNFSNVFLFDDENDFPISLEKAKEAPLIPRDEKLDQFRWENCNSNLLKILSNKSEIN